MPILGVIASSHFTNPVPVDNGAMVPIAVTTLTTNTSSITFSNIPQTYTHLQLRGISRGNTGDFDQCYMRLNADTGNNYGNHAMYGDGALGGAFSTTGGNQFSIAVNTGSAQTTGAYGGMIIDILDYAKTNKYKTVRAFSGASGNTAQGFIWFASGHWQDNSAITSISLQRLVSGSNSPLIQNSTLALYGIKGA